MISTVRVRRDSSLITGAAALSAADYPAPTEAITSFTISNSRLVKRCPNENSFTERSVKIDQRRVWQNHKCRFDHARNNGSGANLFAGIWPANFREGSAARRDEIFHRPSGRNRSRKIE